MMQLLLKVLTACVFTLCLGTGSTERMGHDGGDGGGTDGYCLVMLCSVVLVCLCFGWIFFDYSRNVSHPSTLPLCGPTNK